MIQIEEPPGVKACARCTAPLVWLYSARTGAWVAFATEPTDTRLLRVHDHPLHGPYVPSWRHVTEVEPEVVHAGAARVRQVLSSKKEE